MNYKNRIHYVILLYCNEGTNVIHSRPQPDGGWRNNGPELVKGEYPAEILQSMLADLDPRDVYAVLQDDNDFRIWYRE